jgi:ketosteroid isomerase-like protein
MIDNEKKTIKEILTHHLIAFGNNDLDEILEDYTEESVVITRQGMISGLPAIRKFFEDFFAVIPSGSAFDMDQKIIVANIAYIVWNSESDLMKFPLGTDTFVFDGEKIKYHTVADYRVTK